MEKLSQVQVFSAGWSTVFFSIAVPPLPTQWAYWNGVNWPCSSFSPSTSFCARHHHFLNKKKSSCHSPCFSRWVANHRCPLPPTLCWPLIISDSDVSAVLSDSTVLSWLLSTQDLPWPRRHQYLPVTVTTTSWAFIGPACLPACLPARLLQLAFCWQP